MHTFPFVLIKKLASKFWLLMSLILVILNNYKVDIFICLNQNSCAVSLVTASVVKLDELCHDTDITE